MILAHSSMLRLSYILLRHLAGHLRDYVERALPSIYRRALETVTYADTEARLIDQRACHA